MSSPQVSVKATLDQSEFQRGLKKMQAGTKQTAVNINAAMEIAQKGFAALSKVMGVFIDLMEESISLANIQEKAERSLTAALKIRGLEVDNNFESFNKLNSEIQNSLGIGDETLLNLEAQAIAMGLSTKETKLAIKGAVGLSQVFGKNLNRTLLATARAIKGETSALRTFGIEAKTTTELVKVLGDQYEIAQSQSGILATRVTVLGAAWGDMLEKLGDTVNKSPEVKRAINDLTVAISKFGNYLVTNGPKITRAIDQIISKLRPMLSMVRGLMEAAKSNPQLFAAIVGIIPGGRRAAAAVAEVAAGIAAPVGVGASGGVGGDGGGDGGGGGVGGGRGRGRGKRKGLSISLPDNFFDGPREGRAILADAAGPISGGGGVVSPKASAASIDPSRINALGASFQNLGTLAKGAFADMAQSLGASLASMFASVFDGSQSVLSALGGFVGGILVTMGTMLVQLGTVGILAGTLGSVIPALLGITGGPLGVTAGLAAVAGGAAMIGIGVAMGGSGGGGGGAGRSSARPSSSGGRAPSRHTRVQDAPGAGPGALPMGFSSNSGGGGTTTKIYNISFGKSAIIGSPATVGREIKRVIKAADRLGGARGFA